MDKKKQELQILRKITVKTLEKENYSPYRAFIFLQQHQLDTIEDANYMINYIKNKNNEETEKVLVNKKRTYI